MVPVSTNGSFDLIGFSFFIFKLNDWNLKKKKKPNPVPEVFSYLKYLNKLSSPYSLGVGIANNHVS